MAYVATLDNHRRLTIANWGEQTQINLTTSSPGQQQSQSSNFTTGSWLTEPKLFQVEQGYIVQLVTQQGDNCILVQANGLSVLNSSASWPSSVPVDLQEVTETPAPPSNFATSSNFQSSEPMQPMQPLSMGNMSMDLNSMTMQMGNMSMSLNNQATKQFCPQCGQEAKAGDRFCRSCGHDLQN